MSEELIVNNLNELQKIINKVDKKKNKINKILDNKKKVSKINPDSLNRIYILQDEIIKLKSTLRETKKKTTQKVNFSKKTDNLNDHASETQKVIDIMKKAIDLQNSILKLTKDRK